MAEHAGDRSDTSETKTVERKINLLPDTSSSFLEEGNLKKDFENAQLEQIVNKTLDQIQSISQCIDLNVNNIIDLIMPKIRCELNLNDKLTTDIMEMKDSLKTYMQQMQAVDQDIADIYLDLHTIYRKLDRFDDGSRRLSSANREKLSRRARESEDLQKRSRHYLTNNAKELSAMLVIPPQDPQSTPETNNNIFQGELSPER